MAGVFRKVYSFIRKDFWRKMIALFFALMIYAVVQDLQQDGRTVTDVPVEVVLPPELVSIGAPEFRVTVRAKGPSRGLAQINPNDLRARVRVRYHDFIAGQPCKVRLTPDDFRSFNGVRVTEIPSSESTLVLNLQRRVTRNVRIQPKFDKTRSLSRDYERREVRCIPAEVQVTGPEQILRSLKEVSTQPIPLDESVVESFETRVELEAPEGTVISPENVTVQVDIAKNYISRRFESLPLLFLAQPGSEQRRNFELVDPNKRVTVTIYGQQSSTLALQPEEVKPYIDVSKLTEPGIYTVSISCYVKGDRLDVKDIVPDKIRVKITDRK